MSRANPSAHYPARLRLAGGQTADTVAAMRCLLAADLDMPDAGLRQVMERLNIDLVEADRLGVDWLTQSPTPPIDFVCAVLSERDNRDAEAAIFIDIGVALGRQTPVFLIVEPQRKAPLVVAGLTRVEADVRNEEALELHLRQFLRAIRRGKPEHQASQDRRPVLSQEEADLAHARLRTLKPPSGASDRRIESRRFERLIVDLLDGETADISATQLEVDRGYDIAIWADDASPILGGPVLVQLKFLADAPPSKIERPINEFAVRLDRESIPFGLLIYHSWVHDSNMSGSRESASRRVIAVSAHELVDMLSRQSLSSLLISMRNAVMHGVSYRG